MNRKRSYSSLITFISLLIIIGVGWWYRYSFFTSKPQVTPALRVTDTSFSSTQVEEVKKVVKDFLVQNPELILDIMNQAVHSQQEKIQEDIEENAEKNKDKLLKSAITLGNSKAPIRLLAFLDPMCPNCQELQKIFHGILKDRQDTSISIIPLALLGPNSIAMSRVFLAAAKQNPEKMEKLAFKLAERQEPLNRQTLIELMKDKDVSLNIELLEKDEMDPKTEQALLENTQLANELKIPGVPTVIGFFMGDNKAILIPPIDREGFNHILEQLKSDKGTFLKNAQSQPESQKSSKKAP